MARARLTEDERDRRKQLKRDREKAKEQRQARVDRTILDTEDLRNSVRDWYRTYLASWRRALHAGDLRRAALRAATLVAGLGDGSIPYPPWPEAPWPTVAVQQFGDKLAGSLGEYGNAQVAERKTLRQLLEATVALCDQRRPLKSEVALLTQRVDDELRSLLHAAGASKNDKGRPNESADVALVDFLQSEEALFSGIGGRVQQVDQETGKRTEIERVEPTYTPRPISINAIEERVTELTERSRNIGSLSKLRRSQRT